MGITAAHNAVRAMVQTSPPLPQVTWSTKVAAYAQEWADMLAMTCSMPEHRSGNELAKVGYGENLAAFEALRNPPASTAQEAVDGWAGEVKCWTPGTISIPGVVAGTEKCDMQCYLDMHSDGCGHYTQLVWRDTTEIGCGVASCKTMDGLNLDIWICNYSPAGNIAGTKPY